MSADMAGPFLARLWVGRYRHRTPGWCRGKAVGGRIMGRRIGLVGLLCLLAVPDSTGAPLRRFPPGGAMADTYVIETNHGNITIQLDREKAPLHATNFASYADAGFYEGLI